MTSPDPLDFNQTLDAATIARVDSLMNVPFHLLSKPDKHARTVLGTQRSRQLLSSNPLFARKAAAAETRTGDPWTYWEGYWRSGVNSIHGAVVEPADMSQKD